MPVYCVSDGRKVCFIELHVKDCCASFRGGTEMAVLVIGKVDYIGLHVKDHLRLSVVCCSAGCGGEPGLHRVYTKGI